VQRRLLGGFFRRFVGVLRVLFRGFAGVVVIVVGVRIVSFAGMILAGMIVMAVIRFAVSMIVVMVVIVLMLDHRAMRLAIDLDREHSGGAFAVELRGEFDFGGNKPR
jgi:hypothetical protein